MKKELVHRISLGNVILFLVVLAAPFVFVNKAQAGELSKTSVRLDRMKTSEFTSGMVCAQTPAGNTATEVDVQVTFPATFTVSTTTSNWTVATTDIPGDATAWPGIGTATAASGQTVTFPSTNLTASTYYCFRWTNTAAALQNPGSTGSNLSGLIKTRATGPTDVDSKQYATAIISNDQIVISATVPPTFSFSLSGNTDAFTADLSTSSVISTSGRTVTISTNAASGWVSWVKSANAALSSASTGASVATAGSIDDTPTDLNPTTGYVMDVNLGVTAGNCTIAQNAGYGDEYDGLNTDSGGTLSTTFQPVAECTGGASDNENFTMVERAFISNTQAAATDYTDTLTVVGAGRF